MKKILCIVLALAMVFALCACGSSSSTTAATTETTTTTTDTSTSSSTAAASTDTTAAAKPDKVYTLYFTNHDASTSVGESFCETFLNEIAADCGGQIEWVFNPGGSLYNGGEAVEAVRSGAADACWNATSITNGVFKISEFLNVPLTGINCARMGSKVYQDMLANVQECADEFSEFYVCEVQGNAAAPLSFASKKVETPDDLQGMVIRAAGTVQTQYINAIGASAQGMSTSEVYEALSKNVIEGMTNDWHNIDCFNLYEVVDYVMDYTVNTTSCFLLMNLDTYNSLPEDVQASFDKYQTYGSDMAGWYWDCCRFITGNKVVENGGEVYAPSDEMTAYLQSDDLKAQMADWYVQYLTDAGYANAQELFDTMSGIVDTYAPDYVDPYGTEITLEQWDPACIANY